MEKILRKVLCCWLSVVMVIICSPIPALALDEPASDNEQPAAETELNTPDTEKALEVVLSERYFSVEEGTKAYSEPDKSSEAGVFAADAVVYAEEYEKSDDWEKVVFFVSADSAEQGEWLELYVESKDLEEISISEEDAVLGDSEITPNTQDLYEDFLITVADFESFESAGGAAEEAEEAADSVSEEPAAESAEAAEEPAVNNAPVSVSKSASITSQPADAATSSGQNVKFKVTATGSGLKYQWQARNDSSSSWANTALNGATTATLSFEPTLSFSGRKYRCVVKDKYGATVTSNAATLTVVGAPKITSHPGAASTSSGHNVKFKVTATGTGLTYQWQAKNDSSSAWTNTSLNGATTATLSFEPTLSFSGRKYRCVVKDKYGATVISNAATLTVVAAPKITSHPGAASTSSGQNVKFKVTATGTGLKYQWQAKNDSSSAWANTSLNGATTATLSFEPTISFSGRQYRCVVTDKYGATVTSNAATLTVVAAPKITTHPSSVATSSGRTVSFKVAATGTGLKYQWQARNDSSSAWANTALNGATTATLSFEPTLSFDGRQYRCVVTDKYGASVTSNAATLTVVAAPKITTHPSSTTTSVGRTASFKVAASGTGLKYQWQYRTSSSGSWYDAGVTSTTYSITPSSTSYSGYQYRCVVTDKYGATVTSNVATLTVVAAPTITSNPSSITVYSGQTATFSVSASGTGLKYQWQTKTDSSSSWTNTSLNGATTATLSFETTLSFDGRQYRCVVTDKYGATVTSNAATLTVAAPLKITKHPSSVSVYTGNTATFTVAATGTGVTYQWQYRTSSSGSWSNLSGATSTSYSITPSSTSYSGYQYRCVVTDKYGSSLASNAATLTVTQSVKYRALCVGNNYTGSSSELNGCINDAKAISGMLKTLKTPYTVTTKTDVSASTILSSITSAASGSTSNDVFLFSYSGHGVYDFDYDGSATEYTGALCGYNSSTGSIDYVLLSELASKLSTVNGKVIVILDSCHSGAAVGKDGKLRSVNQKQIDAFNEAVIDAFSGYTMPDPRGAENSKFADLCTSKFIVLTAASYTESSLDIYDYDDGYYKGNFTAALIRGVGATYPNGSYSGSMPADANSNKTVTLGEMYEYIYDQISDDHECQYYGSYSYELFKR